jgi:hypothetical protein
MRPKVVAVGVSLMLWAFVLPPAAFGQNRGVYPLGMSVMNSGVTANPGLTYINQLLFYSRGESKDSRGDVTSTGNQAVLMDMNTISWVARGRAFAGASYSATATIPVAKNQLTGDVAGPISGGAGLADSFYVPLILGWNGSPLSVRVLYGFLAPTGRFVPHGSENVGSGYWTSTVASGQTFYLTAARQFALSAFEMYETHTHQEGTGIKPGDTLNVDYSALQTFAPANTAWHVQAGLVGYEQRQLTERTGPSVSADQSAERYLVNAIGVGMNVVVPKWSLSVGARFFDEFACRSTYQGFSLQFSGAIGF